MKLVIFYSGEFGNRVTGNLVNYSGFCISCGEACTKCRNVAPDLARDIVALVEMPDPASLGDFIDDVEPLLPQNIPAADIALVINVHPDILFGLLPKLKEAGVKGIIGGSESPRELPLGQRKQLEEKAAELGIEAAFAKPFCALRPDPAKPVIATFLKEAKIGESSHRVFLAEEPRGKRMRSWPPMWSEVHHVAPHGTWPSVSWAWSRISPTYGRGSPRRIMPIPARDRWRGTRSWETPCCTRADISSVMQWRILLAERKKLT